MVALTANAMVGAREKYPAAGFEDYLSKPIGIGQLEDVLEKYLPEGLVSYRAEEAAGQKMEGYVLEVHESFRSKYQAVCKKIDA